MTRPRVRSTSTAAAVPVLMLALVLTGCGDDPGNEPSEATRTASASTVASDDDALAAADLVTDLDSPWGLVPLDDGSLLIGSRNTGTISLLAPDASTPVEVASLDVRAEGESGLLGLAVTDDESMLYVYYTTDDDSRVVKMPWDGADLGDPSVVVEGIPGGETFHQGGALAIGPDGLLYVATGDNGDPSSAQDLDSWSGKVLRFALDGSAATDNVLESGVYSYGHRNVEGLAFDDEGRLWASEFGQDAWDEVNLVRNGANYGWPEVEGTGGAEQYDDPVAVWRTEDASPSGLTYWEGSLWMASLRGQTLWEIPLADASAPASVSEPVAHLAGEHGRLRNVVVATGGDALLLATSNTDGRGDPAADDDRLLRLSR
ncbi:PQQ-dependent sugar dehydrogenase [Nocardioides sp.]|uniref:PQQ-dependent sugar dehydrogenase n=1 Tax=Nocardioides sp. TaxID=35761 RepID=UPI002B272C2A|nr:PQQ-dependent sugar dehydrogenase [Nocardioides sp.]